MIENNQKIDIAEDELLKKYPDILKILLCDHSTKLNIFWATDNYKELGYQYTFSSPIKAELITGINNRVITPRILKNKEVRNSRIKNMAEVYTPAWVCNEQNNKIDEAWFGRKNIFNKTKERNGAGIFWVTNLNKIVFPKNKNWKDYINNKRLEITCGEAPYITSRYDTTTGEFIPVVDRIGILDRKLRIISENINDSKSWVSVAQNAYKSTYAYEWQGDSLLLAREAMLYTFIENYFLKFKKNPPVSSLRSIAKIISWNVWQMDGLTGTTPLSCSEENESTRNIFDEIEVRKKKCEGCSGLDISLHNGSHCIIKDWEKKKGKGREIKFIDILK